MNARPEAVGAFYDKFLTSRMLSYRLAKNIRIEKAIGRILQLVNSSSTILDVGCGIGLVAERVASKAKHGFVWACDISPENIWYAKQTIDAPNIDFRPIDILREFEAVKRWITHPIETVVLVDVLEHFPLEDHRSLLTNLRALMASKANLVITVPSPQYQQHLRAKNPNELQVIDEIIEPVYVMTLAQETGFFVRHFSFEDVWLENQYVHYVLGTSADLGSVPTRRSNRLQRIACRLFSIFENHVLLPWRRHKYITVPFAGKKRP